MDRDIIDETSGLISDDTKDNGQNGGNKPSYCPHCGAPKALTERYCPQCGKDRSGEYAPYLAKAVMAAKTSEPGISDAREAERNVISGRAFAIAALVISLFNFLMCATVLTPITLPLVIIFAFKSVKRKGGKKGMITAAVIISVISAIIFGILVYAFVKVYPDLKYMSIHGEEIVREYDINGTIPERFDKYRASKYDDLWDAMGYDDFDEFFDKVVIETYRRSALNGKRYDEDDAEESTTKPSSGEETTTSEESTEPVTSKVNEDEMLNAA